MDIFDFYDKTNLKSYNLDKTMQYQLGMLDRLDVFTRRHSENVADLTCRICEYLHCTKDFTEYATICAYLHDVGKLFIPPHLLIDSFSLTEKEFEIFKQHPQIGYDMGKKDEKLRPYLTGALYHHEALDGSGFPQGLTKKDIPYEAQIIAVADQYDYLVSGKKYTSHQGISSTLKDFIKQPQSETIVEEHTLSKMAAKTKDGKFNPVIVKALFKVIIDNIEYEIYCTNNYISDLKDSLKRCAEIEKYREKYFSSKNEKEKKYYLEGVNILLKYRETFENFEEIHQDYKNALTLRKTVIENLYNEIKLIKQLKKEI